MTELAKSILNRLDAIEFELKQIRKDMATGKPVPVAKQTIPPKREDVQGYFLEHGSTAVEAENFFDSYNSKGWLVGKVRMVNWHSSASKWIRSNMAPVKTPETPETPETPAISHLENKTEALLEERKNMKGVPMPKDVKDMLGRFFDGVKTME